MGSNCKQNGLNIGGKSYLQNDCVDVIGNNGRSGNYHPSSKAAKLPPRCQVEGCSVDLSGSKSYYFRHKVCGIHSKSPMVIVAGLEQRFCQQCSRFHKLPEFDEGKRSCRRRLAGHNKRRRKPPSSSLSSQIRLNTSPFSDDNNIRLRSFVMDFTCPRPSIKNSDSSVALSLLSAQFLSGNSLTENLLQLRPPITTATSFSSNNGEGGAIITLSDISSSSSSKIAWSSELEFGALQRKRQCIELEDVVKSLGLN